jgi:streptogramin lyase
LSAASLTIACLALAAAAPALASPTISELPPTAVQEFAVPHLPRVVAVGPEGDIWMTATAIQPNNTIEEVDRIRASSGVITGEFPLPSGPERYAQLKDLTLGAGGKMWFTEWGRNSAGETLIGSISPAGELIQYPVPAHREGYEFSSVGSIALGPEGHMWFTGELSRSGVPARAFIGRMDVNGEVTEYPIPTGKQLNVPEQSSPASIAPGPDGSMWFTDQGGDLEGHSLVGRITSKGVVTEYSLASGVNYPASMVQGSDGNMWFTANPETVGRVTPTGGVVLYRVSTGSELFASMGTMALGPDGNLWFGDGPGIIVRLTMNGDATFFSRAVSGGASITSIARGPEGNLWYPGASGRIARLTTPLAPVLAAAPTVAGDAAVGSVVSVSDGGWAHEPSSLAFQWQVCDAAGGACESLPGEVGRSTAVTQSELGRRLRAVVTASNVAGSANAASSPSAVVQAAPPPPIELPRPQPGSRVPLPQVGSVMTWRFGWSPRFTVVDLLDVHNLPKSALVEVACRGGGCPFARKRITSTASAVLVSCRRHRCQKAKLYRGGVLSLARLFKGHRLSASARISVLVTRPGWVGKEFQFSTRPTGPPRVRIGCLLSGSSSLTSAC